MVNVNKTDVGVVSNPVASRSLPHWVRDVVDLPTARVRSRLRGNNLHLLFECDPCPEAAIVLGKLRAALASHSLDGFLPAGSPQVYRVVAYGRATTETSPQWTESFELTELAPLPPLTPLTPLSPAAEPVLAQTAVDAMAVDAMAVGAMAASSVDQAISVDQPVDQDQQEVTGHGPLAAIAMASPAAIAAPLTESTADPARSSLELARQGHPTAIAHYLSDTLSHQGIAIQAQVEAVEGKRTADGRGWQRLIILCEAAYVPEPLRLVEDLAKQLRELDLQGFREALVFGQVRGEAKPEWVLRVDLTPPERLLREWARWGDVQAIVRLLNRALRTQNLQVSALLKDATLHLTCAVTSPDQSGVGPDQDMAIAILGPLLAALTPQGIHAVTLYGVAAPAADVPPMTAPEVEPDSPLWVHWFDLPAASTPALATSTLALAQQGHLEALAFLLNRLLNPQLDRTLTTGGVRAQVRQKIDVLHVMTDALNCPPQKQVAQVIGKFVQPLQIPEIVGIRVYGRKAGQKLPLWSQGVDFVARGRLVPQATPEFAASDAYVGDLLTPAGPMVVYADANAPGWFAALLEQLAAWRQQVQRSLVQSQVFVPLETPRLPSPAADPAALIIPAQRPTVALLWGAIGLLLVVQSDWLVGRLLQPPTPSPAKSTAALPTARQSPTPAPSPAALPKLILRKSKPADATTFNDAGFTKPGEIVPPAAQGSDPSMAPSTAPAAATALVASPLLPKASTVRATGGNAYPTFSSRQLDEKLALYQQYMAENGGAPDVLVVGSSRALRGVDPAALRKFLGEQGYKGVRVFNCGINGATAQVVNVLVQQMIPPEARPKLIIWADGARAFNSGREDITFNAIVASPGFKALLAGKMPIPGTLTAQATAPPPPSKVASSAAPTPLSAYSQLNQWLDQGVGRWFMTYPQRDRLKTAVRDQLAALLPKTHTLDSSNLAEATSPAAAAAMAPAAVLSASQDPVDIQGFLPLPNQFNPVTYYQKYAKVSGDFDSDYEDFSVRGLQAEALLSLAQFSRERGIALVFVNLPLTEDYLDATRRRYEEEFQQSLLQLSTQLGFTYRDFSNLPLAQRLFSDPSHLNRYGGYEVSRRLAQDVMIPWTKTR